MYFCISTHKDQLYAELNPTAVSTVANETGEAVKEETIAMVQSSVTKVNPTFAFTTNPYAFKASAAKEDTENPLFKQINEWCKKESCNNDIQFVENANQASWTKETLAMVNYMMENNINNGSINIKENIMTITGDITNAKTQEAMTKLLSDFDSSLQIQDATTLMEQLTATNVMEETPSDITAIESPKETEKIEEAQAKIDALLKNSVINFQLNSSKIVSESQKVLDNIIKIVNNVNMEVNVDIAGHTDVSGSANYNKKLSQKRADSVKDYLLKHNMNAKRFTSVGYGEEKIIFEPNSKKNRRVEIYITKGK